MRINVLEYLIESALQYPDEIFVVSAESGRSYTFHETLFLALEYKKKILEVSSQKNRPIPVIASKSPESVIVFMAILSSQNIYCPIDSSSAFERIKKVIDNLDPELCFLDQVSSRLECQQLVVGNFREVLPSELPSVDQLSKELTDAMFGHIDTDPAYIIHTSGSTGVPKGVTICHRSIIDYIEWARLEYRHTTQDRILSQAPLHFDNSTLDIYLAMAVGAQLHFVPDSYYTFMSKLVEYMNTEGITSVFWVPSVLVNMANLKLLDKLPIKSLNKVLFAGEVMPVPQLNYWIRKLPTALFSNLYGPTEITVDCTFFTLNGEWPEESLPIGYPCRNSGILILNDKNEEVRPNEIGELCVKGSSLALGYWNMPDRTRDVFVQNPLVKSYNELIYRTGDLVRRNEKGLIYFIGRKDSQIKHNGYRIELGEIEIAMSTIPGVNQAVVLYFAEKKRIVALYLADELFSDSYFRESLSAKIPGYMIPQMYIHQQCFPLNANGKVDRLALMSVLKERM